jgi:two-component system, OmpR family, response regulator CpxR
MPTILVIDDDRELCDLLRDYLGPEGYEVTAVHHGEQGVVEALSGKYAFVILDVMLPGLGGFEILRRVRAKSQIPVLMLTARGSDLDRILGLEIGADDYLPKPFNPLELVARMRAIQRRAGGEHRSESRPREILRVGDVMVDFQARLVEVDGTAVDLTSVEFGLLVELLRSAGSVVSRDHLSKFALGRKLQPFDRSIDMHMSNLRNKLRGGRAGVGAIQTVRGEGYVFTLPPVGSA